MARSVTRREFEQLVSEHLPDALRLATRLTRSADAADEVVQNSMLRASKSWKTFRGDASFKTWLHQIIVNVYRDQLAARRRGGFESLERDGEVQAGEQTNPSRQAETRELSELIKSLVQELPTRQREVIVLHSFQQNSPSEIAAILGISESNVYATIHLARSRLREALQSYLAEQ